MVRGREAPEDEIEPPSRGSAPVREDSHHPHGIAASLLLTDAGSPRRRAGDGAVVATERTVRSCSHHGRMEFACRPTIHTGRQEVGR